jgi:hypothetical protein
MELVMGEALLFTPAEEGFRRTIQTKDVALRSFLEHNHLTDYDDVTHWLHYLTGIKDALGNLSNDIGFVATLLVKTYLRDRFGISDFDAAGKPQGASGVDTKARTPDGKLVIGELKTFRPCTHLTQWWESRQEIVRFLSDGFIKCNLGAVAGE